MLSTEGWAEENNLNAIAVTQDRGWLIILKIQIESQLPPLYQLH
ncbi:hypothetical protein [Bathymodiolus thermophilus thioautotrophic gill symbiont]